jgi:signal transduction histidine kinase
LVEDNGKGMDEKARKGDGIGLKNMNSRINSVNGDINFEPSPDSGTLATVRIPITS